MPLLNNVINNTTSNIFVRRYFNLAVENGIDCKALLDEINLVENEFADPSQRIEIQKLADMMLFIWDQMGDECMGLSEHPIPRGTWWLGTKLAVNEPNLRSALKAAIQLYTIATKAYQVRLTEKGNEACLSFTMATPCKDPHHLFSEMTIMAWHRLSAWLIAENIPIKRMQCPYPMPQHLDEYHHMFQTQFEFDAACLSFSFSSNFLQREIIQDQQSLRIFIQHCPYELFMQPRVDFSLSREIRLILESSLLEGIPTMEDTAATLHMTKRTLMRKLKEEGTSFQALKDNVRRDKAIYYLSRQPITISQIATRLGFSDPAVFARAFKAWTGFSPKEYRSNRV